MVDNTAPLVVPVFLEEDTSFVVRTKDEADAFAEADPQDTRIAPTEDGDWLVTRLAGSQIRVPRRFKLSRFVGAQVPDGFDPKVWGLGSMTESVDRLAAWNLVATVDAFISSGFEPAELLRWIHPTKFANTQGTGIGGMQSTRKMYVDALLGEQPPNDVLQEALPNVIAAHTVQAYLGGYGAMVHPVAACATAAVSVEEGVDKIRLDKASVVVAGGFDDLGIEGILGFGNMSATADTAEMLAKGIDERHVCRPNDRRRGGFVEGQGGGTVVLARGDVALEMGLPVLGVDRLRRLVRRRHPHLHPRTGDGRAGRRHRWRRTRRWPRGWPRSAWGPTTWRWCRSTTPRPRPTTPTSRRCTRSSPTRSGRTAGSRCTWSARSR